MPISACRHHHQVVPSQSYQIIQKNCVGDGQREMVLPRQPYFSLPPEHPGLTQSVLRTSRHPLRRRINGIQMSTIVSLRRIHPGQDRVAFGAIHGRPKRASAARRRAMSLLVLQARECFVAVFAGIAFSPRVLPGTRAPATSTIARASLRPPGCGRGYRCGRRCEGRCGCGHGRGGRVGGGMGSRCNGEKLAPFVFFQLNVLDIREGGNKARRGRTSFNGGMFAFQHASV